MKKLAKIMAVSILLAAPIASAKTAFSLALKQLLIDRINAISKKDTLALNQICTKNYQIIGSLGTKTDLAGLKSELFKNDSPIQLCTILSFQPFITEDESMAFALFEIEEDVVGDNRHVVKNNLLVTEIYKKEKGKWRTQLSHVSQKICSFPN
jgi:hypothetical protein